MKARVLDCSGDRSLDSNDLLDSEGAEVAVLRAGLEVIIRVSQPSCGCPRPVVESPNAGGECCVEPQHWLAAERRDDICQVGVELEARKRGGGSFRRGGEAGAGAQPRCGKRVGVQGRGRAEVKTAQTSARRKTGRGVDSTSSGVEVLHELDV